MSKKILVGTIFSATAVLIFAMASFTNAQQCGCQCNTGASCATQGKDKCDANVTGGWCCWQWPGSQCNTDANCGGAYSCEGACSGGVNCQAQGKTCVQGVCQGSTQAETCQISVSPGNIALGQSETFTYTSAPQQGYHIYLYGTKNGAADLNGTTYGWITDFTQQAWTPTQSYQEGIYERWFEARDAGGNVACTSPKATFTVGSSTPANATCDLSITPSSITLGQSTTFHYTSNPTGYRIKLFQTKDGATTIGGTDYGWLTNYTQQPWTPTQPAQAGNYITWFEARDGGANTICQSAAMPLSVQQASASCTTHPSCQALPVPSCSAPATGCRTDARGVSTSYHPGVNADLGDYGVIFKDAANPACSSKARDLMLEKITNTLAASGYGDWLEGVNVSLIFAAALEMGGQGTLTQNLDAKLQDIREQYKAGHYIDNTCGVTGSAFGNTCMDDYAIEGSAFAWIAAYEAKSGRSASEYITKAKHSISMALSPQVSACLYTLGQPNVCLTAMSNISQAIAEDQIEVTSYNHNQQNPSYGVGLVSSISSAAVALQIAGSPYTPASPAERAIGMGLLEDAQRKSYPDGCDYKTNCYDLTGISANANKDCADTYGYIPKMFPVNAFYSQIFGSPSVQVIDALDNTNTCQPQQAYGFDQFARNYFCDTSDFFHAGREVIYGDLADAWWTNRPPLNGFTAPQQSLPKPVLTSNKNTFLIEESFALDLSGASPNSAVEFLWWKNTTPFDGGCGAGIWCKVGTNTGASGEWSLSGRYLDAILVGQWRERARVAGVETNDISFVVNAPTSPSTCSQVTDFASNCASNNTAVMTVPSVVVSSDLVAFPVTVTMPPSPPNAIWGKGYYWSPTKYDWIEFALKGTPYSAAASGWLKDNAEASVSVPKADLAAGTNYVLTWQYTYINNQWVGPPCADVRGCWRVETFVMP